MEQKVLVVDDEKAIVDILVFNLQKEGYNVITASDGEEGLNKALNENPDLIILDVMMPKLDGIGVCKQIRQKNITTPIIMVTAKADEVDKILGLELGADDYVTKPFSVRELMARVKANMRRILTEKELEKTPKNIIKSGKLEIDLDRYEVKKGNDIIELTVRRLREKVEDNSNNPAYVMTKRGIGYYFKGEN